MNLVSILAVFVISATMQLTLETTAELTAETFADNDVGIVVRPSEIASGDIVDLSPSAVLNVRH